MMFLNRASLDHHRAPEPPSGLITSVPANQFNDTAHSQTSLGRNLLLKPIEFVSNHRRSASLSGLVRRSSTRKVKSRLPTPTTFNPLPPQPPSPTTTNHNLTHSHSQQEGHANQISHHLHDPQPALTTNPQPHPPVYFGYSDEAAVPIHTLPIIQPRPNWGPGPSYEMDRRCFRINLNQPRQQVTSLLALSSIPRPVTPPFDDERENTASAIMNATRTAIEEEAIRAAIAASIESEHRRLISHWADDQKSYETDGSTDGPETP